STTIVCVRLNGKVAMASDGRVTLGTTIMKKTAAKIRRLAGGDVLAGFAGSSADAFALFSRFEAKLDEYRGNLDRAAIELAGARTPREIVGELDKYVIGQARAKRAVAIALRNRWRRQQLDPEMSREILPKNILMIGPTGVGKTEIARRLARLADAPFLKVEASKFTEVGYVGRDVESIIRDLTEVAVQMVRDERTAEIRDRAKARTEQRLVELLMPSFSDSDIEEAR